MDNIYFAIEGYDSIKISAIINFYFNNLNKTEFSIKNNKIYSTTNLLVELIENISKNKEDNNFQNINDFLNLKIRLKYDLTAIEIQKNFKSIDKDNISIDKNTKKLMREKMLSLKEKIYLIFQIKITIQMTLMKKKDWMVQDGIGRVEKTVNLARIPLLIT